MSKAPAVDYALRIIELFAKRQGDVGLADINNSLDINKNAASRVLESMLEHNWIYQSDSVQKKYRFTQKPFALVAKCSPKSGLCELAKGELEKLNRKLGDSVYLGIEHENKVLYLLHLDSTREVRINGSVGGEYPLKNTAPGKILLAFSGREDDKGIEAEKICACGYAVDDEEFARGIICIACPVFDDTGKVVAAVGISSLTIYDSMESLVKEKLVFVKNAAMEISKKLGYKE